MTLSFVSMIGTKAQNDNEDSGGEAKRTEAGPCPASCRHGNACYSGGRDAEDFHGSDTRLLAVFRKKKPEADTP